MKPLDFRPVFCHNEPMKSAKSDSLVQICRHFPKVRIAVVGDVMLDEYTVGVIERLSPEAPVPVVVDRERRYILGGAAGTAANVSALGGQTFLIGAVGNDLGGKIIKRLCKEKKIVARLVTDPSRPTTKKNRIIVNHHQLLRVDTEDTAPVSARTEKELIRQLAATKADLVIFSDYAKGVVTRRLVAAAKKKFGARRVLADFKPSQAESFRGVGVIFPNLKEARELTGIHADSVPLARRAVSLLAKRFGSAVVLKRGEHGMSLQEGARAKVLHLTAQTHEVFDVTGAGDTVIAVMALALGTGAPFAAAAELANHAAGIVVEKEGTAVLTPEELMERIESLQ
jgi:D-beta-D-heptose 7-phosphate kinase/D-beta-D-heptose 1-phosphate adenosyltransferase